MKALVLAGGFPQIDLINKLKDRGIYTVLADYLQHPIAVEYADKFYRISTLDIDAIRQLAIQEKVDFIITVCTDQSLLTMAIVSAELGLPCYIDQDTALKVTNKVYMKEVFKKNKIPTAEYVVASNFDEVKDVQWAFPVIVKPADCNSSKGVIKVHDFNTLKYSFNNALQLSRSNKVIVENYIEGKELSIDAYVEDGNVKILDVTTSEKLKIEDKFIIFRTWHPASLSQEQYEIIKGIIQKIADCFGLVNTPLLVQILVKGNLIFVIEFSARTGGGVKHLSIMRRSGVDVVSAVIDLSMGEKPHIITNKPEFKYMIDEYIYCNRGIFDHVEGFDELVNDGTLLDYYLFRSRKSPFMFVENSGDRIGGITIQGNSYKELKEKHDKMNISTRILSEDGDDIMRHDILSDFDPNMS